MKSIQAKPLFRAALLAIAILVGSLSMGLVSAPAASAAGYYVYGNVIIEGYGSTANLWIAQTGSNTVRQMRPNTRSDNWPTFMRNVNGFLVPNGYVAVNGHTGAGFGPGWHWMTGSNSMTVLQVETQYCWYLRSQLGTPCKVYPAS